MPSSATPRCPYHEPSATTHPMPTSSSAPLDDLPRYAGSLRALARGILADEHEAEDIVQQVFVRTILNPPSDRGALGAWLGRATRRLALNAARAEGRRRRRERATARAEEADDEAEGELAVQRLVLEAVAALHEPYRTAIHLRYYRDMSPTRIARELDVPVKTVQARLTRAHRMLRERLGRAFREERGAWSMLLVPGAVARTAEAKTILGGILMAKEAVLAGVAVIALGGVWLAWRTASSIGDDSPDVATAPSRAATGETVPDVPPEPERGAAVAGDSSTEATPPSTSADAAPSPEVELREALDGVLAAIEGSFEGMLDPGAVLEGALLLATHETGPALPEPDPGGGLVFPLREVPEGVEAELCVSRNIRGEMVLGLRMRFDEPSDPWLVAGLDRSKPKAVVTAWTNDAGELRHVTVLTVAQPGPGMPFGDLSEWSDGVSLYTPMDAPDEWKLKVSGMRATDDGVDETGTRHWESASWEPPQMLAGDPWPRVNDLKRLSELLRARHEEIRTRSQR